ncbi:uncharacterized protein MELLADRAFT_110427 [Melampsora larici-populina 98AG31]|uniref:SNARE-complex protein Syntaxin-18 N-terminal domain-containing protein n=1 Tax=Melampsora larici-populina (strain 98AG31 / pathotype 3-4-7) TaxID=747676 RepID=F4RZS4_MELLP|nr:uncharacterized protein MELLADRAFT_110427 [Melampsora larici-populina 98AG31]EGG02053.1 hypothetical protein MELLADRAFT_110427 [Melampsora larici-populina 98AG31]
MPSSTSRTLEFKEILQQHKKNQNLSKPINPKSPISKTKPPSNLSETQTWSKEAKVVNHNIQDLLEFLKTIKRAYLDPTPSRSSTTHHNSTKPLERQVEIKRGFQGFSQVRWFSEQEKDEIDVLVGVGLKKSIQGVRALEAAENSRKSQHSNQTSTSISRFLNLPLLISSDLNFEQISLHRASILWYLNDRLTKLSQLIKDQQETRAEKKRQKLSNGGLAGMASVKDLSRTMIGSERMISTSDQVKIPSVFKPSQSTSWSEDPLESKPIEEILTSTQLHQFDSESSALLRMTETTLTSIKQTESSLLEISNLQSELVLHLTHQTELIDTLWDDSLVSTGKVSEGNLQLLKAKENNRESRIWLLCFLLGASFALLFVDYIAP